MRKMKTKKEINHRIYEIFNNCEGMFLNECESARITELLWMLNKKTVIPYFKTFIGNDAYEQFCDWTDGINLEQGEINQIIVTYTKRNTK